MPYSVCFVNTYFAEWRRFGTISAKYTKTRVLRPENAAASAFTASKKDGSLRPDKKLYQSSSRAGSGAACRAPVSFSKRSARTFVVRYAEMQSIAILFLPPRMIAKSASLM